MLNPAMSQTGRELLRFGPFTLDAGERLLWRGGEIVPLTPKAFDLLAVLVQNPGRVLSKAELIERVWPDAFVEEANLSHQIYRLRTALGDAEGEASYIDTLNRRGYRFVAAVSAIVPAPVQEAAASIISVDAIVGEPHEHSTEPRAGDNVPEPVPMSPGRSRFVAAVTVALMTVGILLVGIRSWRATSTPTSPAIQSLAVLPFTALSPWMHDEALELGMADAVITRLSNLKQVIVRPTSAVLPYTREPRDILAIAREQRVDAVLEGKIQKSADRLRVTVQLLRASDARPIWAQTFDQPLEDLFAIQDAISGRVVDALQVTLTTAERQGLGRQGPANMDAYNAFVRGTYFANSFSGDTDKSISEFRRAIALDPDYVDAAAGLASALTLTGFTQPPSRSALQEARSLTARALQLDPDSATAHTAATYVALYVDWDWNAADRESRWLVASRQNDADAHQLRGWYQSLMGRPADALADIRLSQQLSPLAINRTILLGDVLVRVGDTAEGIDALQRAITGAPGNAAGRTVLAQALFRLGRGEDAIAVLREAPAGSGPAVAATLGFLLARAGRSAEAKQILEQLSTGPVAPPAYLVATVQSGLGDATAAIASLERAISEQSPWIAWLKTDAQWESLRTEPAFQALLHRVALDR